MITGKKFRIYPSGDQAKTLLQWIGHQRFIYNAKVQEDRYFRKFAHKALSLVGEQVPCDQQYSQFKTEETAFLKEVPSQIHQHVGPVRSERMLINQYLRLWREC